MAWEAGTEGCETPGDLGWMHGTEDIGGAVTYRAGVSLTPGEFDDYKEGYKDARRGWD